VDTLINRCIFVIGTGRSGTSAVANVLHHLGVFMGAKLSAPGPTNRWGNYEDREFYEFNRAMAHGGTLEKGQPLKVGTWEGRAITIPEGIERFKSFQAARSSYPIWGVKDPGLCYTLPVLAPLIEDLRVIVARRPAEESIASYRRAYGASAREASEWYYDVRKALDANLLQFRGPLMEVQFRDLLTDTKVVVNSIVEFVFDGMDKPGDDVIEAACGVVVNS